MRISDWSADVCSSDLPETASRAPCAASACAIADPIPPEAPVTRAVMPVRSNMEISPGIVCSERFKQRLDVVHRQDAGRRDLPRRAALDHGGQHLAAEFDELVNRSEEHTSELQSLL